MGSTQSVYNGFNTVSWHPSVTKGRPWPPCTVSGHWAFHSQWARGSTQSVTTKGYITTPHIQQTANPKNLGFFWIQNTEPCHLQGILPLTPLVFQERVHHQVLRTAKCKSNNLQSDSILLYLCLLAPTTAPDCTLACFSTHYSPTLHPCVFQHIPQPQSTLLRLSAPTTHLPQPQITLLRLSEPTTAHTTAPVYTLASFSTHNAPTTAPDYTLASFSTHYSPTLHPWVF